MNCSRNVAEKLGLSAEDTEKKFKKIRAAYGRYLKKLVKLVKKIPSGFGLLNFFFRFQRSQRSNGNQTDRCDRSIAKIAEQNFHRSSDCSDYMETGLKLYRFLFLSKKIKSGCGPVGSKQSTLCSVNYLLIN